MLKIRRTNPIHFKATASTFRLVIKSGFGLLSPKEGGYIFTCVCPFVCPLDYSKSYERILMKFLEGWDVARATID